MSDPDFPANLENSYPETDVTGEHPIYHEAMTAVTGTDDSQAIANLITEAQTMATDNPTITVIAKLNGSKVVRSEWSGATNTLSDRTIAAVGKLGITVVDDPTNYLFGNEADK